MCNIVLPNCSKIQKIYQWTKMWIFNNFQTRRYRVQKHQFFRKLTKKKTWNWTYFLIETVLMTSKINLCIRHLGVKIIIWSYLCNLLETEKLLNNCQAYRPIKFRRLTLWVIQYPDRDTPFLQLRTSDWVI